MASNQREEEGVYRTIPRIVLHSAKRGRELLQLVVPRVESATLIGRLYRIIHAYVQCLLEDV